MNIDETTTPPLPELSDERIDELEEALFAGIARQRVLAQDQGRRTQEKRMRRRRAIWWTTAAAAVVVVGAAAIGPLLTGRTGFSGAGADSAVGESVELLPAVPDTGDMIGDGAAGGAVDATAEREIIATAQATVRVDDVAGAAQSIAAAAEARGGYVESMNIGENGLNLGTNGTGAEPGVMYEESLSYPMMSGSWITVRVPAGELTGAIDELSALGSVESSSINRQDVTEQAVDLRARIDALEASVARLTDLMGQAGSVADLISAESALSERQAELESLQQQLTSIESQVSLSALTVSLVQTREVVEAEPAGFGDGLASGWNGLIATLNGLIVALGFLLPWLVVAAVVAVIVWLIIRARRRAASAASGESDAGTAERDEV